MTICFLQDEYLEAAPESEGCQEAVDNGIQTTSQAADAIAGPAAAQPALPALPAPQVQVQVGAQASPSAAKGPSTVKARPRAATRSRAAKAAQQVKSTTDVQQQQQPAPDDSQTRYLRMMQESGVTPEEMEEAY